MGKNKKDNGDKKLEREREDFSLPPTTLRIPMPPVKPPKDIQNENGNKDSASSKGSSSSGDGKE